MKRIIRLGDALARQSQLVGGKAATLSLLAADYPVPPGFCVVLVADDARGIGLGQSFQHDLVVAYIELAERCGREDVPVAVRSSALEEDGERASFAG